MSFPPCADSAGCLALFQRHQSIRDSLQGGGGADRTGCKLNINPFGFEGKGLSGDSR